MIKYVLEPVDNGIIKTIIDDNIDGAGKKLEKKEIYILEDKVINTEKFLMNLIEDLGLYLGNAHDKNTLAINKVYGDNYKLNNNELMEERKKLTHRLNKLKTMSLHKIINEDDK